MKRSLITRSALALSALLFSALLLLPKTARAIDTVDPNAPISCSGTEVYYPRGDAWAFPASAAEECQGTDPYVLGTKEQFYQAIPLTSPARASNWAPDIDAAKWPTGVSATTPTSAADTGPHPEDKLGHCLWVFFTDGELGCANNNCPSGGAGPTGEPGASELARMTVFADMRKWTGYNSGQQKLPTGTANFQWICPSTAATPQSDKASVDYTFGKTNAMPSVSFYRGNNIAEFTDSTNAAYNKGDITDCFAPCKAGASCNSACTSATPPCSPAPSPMLYACDNSNPKAAAVADCNGSTDCTQEQYRFQSARNVVQWVNHTGDWASKLQYGASTLAVTETIFWPDTGVSITSDMFINNDNVKWRWKDIFDIDTSHEYFGCSDSDPACFYLETVTTHESGHFIGFGHVDCPSAIMYATATPQTTAFNLGIGEEAGVCAMYRPAANNTTSATVAVAPAVGSPFIVEHPARSPAVSGTNEGCFKDTDCGATDEKCIFSKRSFYGSSPPATTSLISAIPHRGVCAKTCSSNNDCNFGGPTGNFYGRVCQPYSDDGSVSYCLPGSPDRPKVTVGSDADLCAACASGSDCSNGICINLQASGLTDIPADAPSGICSVPCSPASGCDANFECRATGSGRFGCVPLGSANFETCLHNALLKTEPLNSFCTTEQTCATGLLCYSFAPASAAAPEGVNACVVECDPNTPCPTPNERCLYTTAGACSTDADCPTNTLCQGQQCQTFIGACFKAAMKEGESCALPSSATCGLSCSKATDAGPNCVEEPSLGCFEADATHPEKAACYALCSSPPDITTPCPNKNQTCTPLTDANGNPLKTGVCTPLSSSFCLLQTGTACSANGDCDSDLCTTFGALKTCTNYCDLRTQTGCPKDTACVDIKLDCDNGVCCDPTKSASCTRTRGACKVTGTVALASNCPGVTAAGCGCSSGPNALESSLACAAAALVLLRRRRAAKRARSQHA